ARLAGVSQATVSLVLNDAKAAAGRIPGPQDRFPSGCAGGYLRVNPFAFLGRTRITMLHFAPQSS
ncbi:MAG: LacI family DNA-binding transcriptional regulator, partial [Burkholderiales bacterium]|nr:LacI family DNA-binding transcriptional regulator [Burkholderiales bacterium]